MDDRNANRGASTDRGTAIRRRCETGDGKPSSATADADDPDLEGVRERLERYFVVSAATCPTCGELHRTVTVAGESYTAADFGVDSLAERELLLGKEETWIRTNRDAVEAVLPRLEADWPGSVSAVRRHVL